MNQSKAETIQVSAGLRGIHLISFVLGLLIVGISLYWASDRERVKNLITSLQFFKIETIDIKTEWPLESSKVESWVGSLKGENILLLDANQLIQTIKTHSWVETVAINKGYPNRIQIVLTTKKPQAIILNKGQSWFVDPNGVLIEKVSGPLMKGLELPFLSFDNTSQNWNVSEFLKEFEKVKNQAGDKFTVAQIVLGKFPYFKTYLSQPKIEVLWSFENWQSQVEHLIQLILNPPSQIGQLRRINLVFPKKAVVSSMISH